MISEADNEDALSCDDVFGPSHPLKQETSLPVKAETDDETVNMPSAQEEVVTDAATDHADLQEAKNDADSVEAGMDTAANQTDTATKECDLKGAGVKAAANEADTEATGMDGALNGADLEGMGMDAAAIDTDTERVTMSADDEAGWEELVRICKNLTACEINRKRRLLRERGKK